MIVEYSMLLIKNWKVLYQNSFKLGLVWRILITKEESLKTLVKSIKELRQKRSKKINFRLIKWIFFIV